MAPRRLGMLVATGIVLVVALVANVGARRATATPVFAQAYGLSCTACHTQMPALNVFGRYIQRTGYGALDSKTLEHAIPAFVLHVGTSYVSKGGQPAADNRINGPLHNTVLQADSALGPDLTYKIEQLIYAQGQSGFLDHAWIGYHNLARRRSRTAKKLAPTCGVGPRGICKPRRRGEHGPLRLCPQSRRLPAIMEAFLLDRSASGACLLRNPLCSAGWRESLGPTKPVALGAP